MYDTHPLADPWLKVVRAQDHLKALDKAIGRFYARPDACRVTVKDHTESGFKCIRAELTNPDMEIGVIAGEFLYQMRTALDHLGCALIKGNGEAVSDRSGFPIFAASNPGRFDPAVAGMPVEAIRLIKSLQPYEAAPGDKHYPLFVLHKLSIADKHASLTAKGSGLSMRIPADPRVKVEWRDHGAEILLPSESVPPDFKPQPTFEVVFGAEDMEPDPDWYGPDLFGSINHFVRDQVFPLFTRFFPDSTYFRDGESGESDTDSI